MSSGPEPILEGPGKSDYERYIRTDELLSLQKGPETWEHRDELLFTVVHQSSELWLKLACSECDEARRLLSLDPPAIYPAARHLGRALLCLKYTIEQLDMLEEMTPWDYQQVRLALGHGSGFDSPGFNAIRTRMPDLGADFFALLEARGLALRDLYVQHAEHDDLHSLAEMLISLDEAFIDWRDRHYRVVERSIGFDVVGTQGTPVEVIGGLRNRQFFPELWRVRGELTRYADETLR
jgi:tryptophan 2,3-dioxygenase